MALQPPVRKHRCDFWALFWPSKDVDGQWVAHCLNFDIVSQGNSLMHARDMLIEAVALSLMDDFEAGRDPIARPSAPKEYWDKMKHVLEKGERVKFSEVPTKGSITVATVIGLEIRIEKREVQIPNSKDIEIPPAYLIDAMSSSSDRVHA